jgi:hypothetical protein
MNPTWRLADPTHAALRVPAQIAQIGIAGDLTCDTFGGLDGGRLADLRVLGPGRADVRTKLEQQSRPVTP